MNDAQKQEAIDKWKIDGPIREAERVKTGKRYLDPTLLDDFNTKMTELRTKYPILSVPAMVRTPFANQRPSKTKPPPQHFHGV